MDPTPATDSTPAPYTAPPVPPLPNWVERRVADVAHALHQAAAAIEGESKQLATVAWPMAAQFVSAYYERNKAELGQKAAAAIVAVLVAEIPALTVSAPTIAGLIVSEAEAMFA